MVSEEAFMKEIVFHSRLLSFFHFHLIVNFRPLLLRECLWGGSLSNEKKWKNDSSCGTKIGSCGQYVLSLSWGRSNNPIFIWKRSLLSPGNNIHDLKFLLIRSWIFPGRQDLFQKESHSRGTDRPSKERKLTWAIRMFLVN